MIDLDTTRIIAAQSKTLADAVADHAAVLEYCRSLPNPAEYKIGDALDARWPWCSSTRGYEIVHFEVQKRFRAELNDRIHEVADKYRKAADQALVDLKTMIANSDA